jgi:hypothetical protein
MNSHIANSVVSFASLDLERFINSFEINPVFDYMSDFKKRESIIEGLVEAKKMKELIYLVNYILKSNVDQLILNIFIQDLPMLLKFKKVDLNEFLNLSIVEDSNF